jgi:hypothetical protein
VSQAIYVLSLAHAASSQFTKASKYHISCASKENYKSWSVPATGEKGKKEAVCEAERDAKTLGVSISFVNS